jgi:hypothetical protein
VNEIEVFNKLNKIAEAPQFSAIFDEGSPQSRKIAEHRDWLHRIRHERPSTDVPYKVGVYIRYFNQTKYEDYLDFHKKQFADTIALCPKWTFYGFYIDEGATAPNMESAREWGRLLNDCYEDKVDLIITQKVSNVSKSPFEIALCARLLAAKENPTGIYFISEDIFTLSSYYQEDLKDPFFANPNKTASLTESKDERSLHD